MAETSFTLLQLNSMIKSSVKELFPDSLWIIGEVHEMNENYSGHCYLELVEKDENSDQIVARARATIWVMTWRMLKPYFETATGQELDSGIKVLVNATVEFHELYGFSLNIKDIDPVYTLGDLEKKKAEIIRKLESEGIMDMNKGLELTEVPQRIAVISSKTAAGLQDFLEQLGSNSFGYKFHIEFFVAAVQGKQAEVSITQALDKIYNKLDNFDAVVIIRGGGAKSDMNCFNSYLVASHVAQFPLPVITGIGHERDVTITDLVSHTRVKTPTAAAEFIIAKFSSFETGLLDIQFRLAEISADMVSSRKEELFSIGNRVYPGLKARVGKELQRFVRLESSFSVSIKNYFLHLGYKTKKMEEKTAFSPARALIPKKDKISYLQNNFLFLTKNYLTTKDHQLHYQEDITLLHHPDSILKKGFAIVTHDGKMVKSARALKKSDIIATKFRDGRIESIVGNIDLEE